MKEYIGCKFCERALTKYDTYPYIGIEICNYCANTLCKLFTPDEVAQRYKGVYCDNTD